jgi:hypothetical protein
VFECTFLLYLQLLVLLLSCQQWVNRGGDTEGREKKKMREREEDREQASKQERERRKERFE